MVIYKIVCKLRHKKAEVCLHWVVLCCIMCKWNMLFFVEYKGGSKL